MPTSFMQTAIKQVVDVTAFLKEAAGGNGIKYKAESGKQHRIYIPTVTVEVEVDGVKTQQQQMIAMSGKVHDWTEPGGRYASTICLEGVVRKADDGTVLNDGSCPFCKRVADAWDIYNYRYQQEEETCQLTGENRTKHLENCRANFASERKAKEAAPYLYILVAKFKTTDDGQPILTEGTQLPAYDLKIMKLSASRVEKIQKQCKNSGVSMVGTELLFDYSVSDDIRQVVGQSTVTPVVLEQAKFTVMHPAVLEQINKDVAKFTWEGLDQAFSEWKGMTTLEANNVVESLFHKWDEYQQQKLINPMAKYMEYAYQLPTSNPPINPQVPTLNGVATPNIPVPNVTQQNNIPVVPNIPGMSQQASETVNNTQANAQAANIPGMNNQNIPGMSGGNNTQQTGGAAMTANQLLGGGPTFVM